MHRVHSSALCYMCRADNSTEYYAHGVDNSTVCYMHRVDITMVYYTHREDNSMLYYSHRVYFKRLINPTKLALIGLCRSLAFLKVYLSCCHDQRFGQHSVCSIHVAILLNIAAIRQLSNKRMAAHRIIIASFKTFKELISQEMPSCGLYESFFQQSIHANKITNKRTISTVCFQQNQTYLRFLSNAVDIAPSTVLQQYNY